MEGVEGVEGLPLPLEILERVDLANERRELVSESRCVGLVVVLEELDVVGRSMERVDPVGEIPSENDTAEEAADFGERSSGVSESVLASALPSSALWTARI